ncbi:MAG: hypothetical protein HYY93_05135 [Planctomycetes bacterium]|nr:hypothetical protein [Planctomycetota bacterium]
MIASRDISPDTASGNAALDGLSAWAARHVSAPWNATCRTARGWVEGRELRAEEAVVGTPMTPFRADYRCLAPLVGSLMSMALPGDGRLVTLITHPAPLEEGRRRAIFRAYVETTGDGHMIAVDPLPREGPFAVEAGRAIAEGHLASLPGIVNAHLPALGHAPAAWVKVADLRFFAPFRRCVSRYEETGDLTGFVRDTLLAIECVYREGWIAFAPEPPCFGRLREIASAVRPLLGKPWSAQEVLSTSDAPLSLPSPLRGEGNNNGSGADGTAPPLTLPSPPPGERETAELISGAPPARPDGRTTNEGAVSERAARLPRLCLAVASRKGEVSAILVDPANLLHLTPPYEAVRACRGVPFHRLARTLAAATGADFVEAVREETLLRIAAPLVGKKRGRGDASAWFAAVRAWVLARLRYGREVVSWPGPIPPRILPLLARVALSNVR